MAKVIDTIKLKGGYVSSRMSPEELEVYLRERNRGCGSHSSKKIIREEKNIERGGFNVKILTFFI